MYNLRQNFNNDREKIGCTNGSYIDSTGKVVLSNPFEQRPNYSYDSSQKLIYSGNLVETNKKNYFT